SAERPQQRIEEARRVAECLAERLAKRLGGRLEQFGRGAELVPRGGNRGASLVKKALAIDERVANDVVRNAAVLAVDQAAGVDLVVELAVLRLDLLGHVGQVLQTLGKGIRLQVLHLEDRRT